MYGNDERNEKKLNAKPIIADQSHIENEARSLAS